MFGLTILGRLREFFPFPCDPRYHEFVCMLTIFLHSDIEEHDRQSKAQESK